MIELVSPILVDRVWPQIREGIAEACRKGGNQFSEAWLHVGCRKGDMYLGVMHEGGDLGQITMASVMQEQQWLDRQVLLILTMSGENFMQGLPEMLAWAKGMFPGCKSVVFEGRTGWQKLPGVRVLRISYEMDF